MERDSSTGHVLPWMPADRPGPHDDACLPASPPENSVDSTGAEARYYKTHMMQRTPMVVVTLDGGKSIGWIEWYDREVLKLHSMTEPNTFFSKSDIKYIYRHADDPEFKEPIPTPPPITRSWTGRRGRRS